MSDSPDGAVHRSAGELFDLVANHPIVSPHGHVDPSLFSDPDYQFEDPAHLLIVPDHYVTRMLYSQGIPLESLGLTDKGGDASAIDPRDIWQVFADNVHLFRGTPSAQWLDMEFRQVFGINEYLTSENAQGVYDHIANQLQSDAFRPRTLFDSFNIEVLCTTDAATDTLEHHKLIAESGWHGRILPTFRPDALTAIDNASWRAEIELLEDVSGVPVNDAKSFIQAIEQRRDFFRSMGAVATDHGVETAHTEILSDTELEAIFSRALAGSADSNDVLRFGGHMLCEMARMSCEDGLVMQLHAGASRNHNQPVFDRFGPDMGADIPIRTDFTANLRPLLNAYGNDTRLRLVLFSLDESPYAREMAPIAGHYPAVRIGPPWWFHDSMNGMTRYFDRVMETAGLHNTAGFNDDTRAYPSIPARHVVWRRASARWVAGLLVDGRIRDDDAVEMMHDLAYRLVKTTYRLDQETA